MRSLLAAMLSVTLIVSACGSDDGGGGEGTAAVPGTREPVPTAAPNPTIAAGDGATALSLLQAATVPDESLPEELDGYVLQPSQENLSIAWNEAPVAPSPGAVLSYSGSPDENGGVLLLILVYPTADLAAAAFQGGEFVGAGREIIEPATTEDSFDGAAGACVSGRTAEGRDLAVCGVQEGNVMIAATSAMLNFTEGRSNLVAAQELAEYGLIHSRLVLEQ